MAPRTLDTVKPDRLSRRLDHPGETSKIGGGLGKAPDVFVFLNEESQHRLRDPLHGHGRHVTEFIVASNSASNCARLCQASRIRRRGLRRRGAVTSSSSGWELGSAAARSDAAPRVARRTRHGGCSAKPLSRTDGRTAATKSSGSASKTRPALRADGGRSASRSAGRCGPMVIATQRCAPLMLRFGTHGRARR